MVLGYVCPCCGIKNDYLEEFSSSKMKKLAPEQKTNKSRDEEEDFMICMPCHNPSSATTATPAETEEIDMSIYTIPLDTSVVCLKAQDAFHLLTNQEKLYAYYIGKASWEGSKICLLQCSPESVPIFSLFQLCFGENHTSSLSELLSTAKTQLQKELTEEDITHALLYIAAFYGNLGNYKSFGDTKFIPQIQPSKFKLFLQTILQAKGNSSSTDKFETYWKQSCVRMYSLLPRQRQMGLGKKNGITTYFSSNCEESDAEITTSFLNSLAISPYNTRLFKKEDGTYIIKVASSATDIQQYVENKHNNEFEFKGKKFIFQFGDYHPLMKRINENLNCAIQYCANDTQKLMLQEYVKSFKDGSIEAHKNGSRYWIKDISPSVESYIGFIESYRDPSGSRGEFEGFVSCVNKEVSKKFQTLVDKAPDLLKLMPWDVEFEKKKFQRPDFTSLEVLAFGSSGVPAGINIPNYDDIRQNEGFKNVSLGNVLQASYGANKDKPVTFIIQEDQELFKTLKGPAFEVQVGIHELLGHGSGRLYHKDSDETKEFLDKKIVNPLTKEVLTGPFYDIGSTWDSTFGKIASNYEECRAECCGLYLSLENEVLNVFGHTVDADGSGGIHDITYINWLLMVRAGLTGLEFYTPETKGWRQAHMNARYVILRVLLEAGEDLVKLEVIKDKNDGEPNVDIYLNRGLISTVGRKAIGDFLLKLQIYKSLGDFENGNKMFSKYSEVPEDMTKLRKIVMERKEPRKLLVQPHMSILKNADTEPSCTIQEFDETPEGMIESFAARFPAEDPELWSLYEADASFMEG